MSRGTRRIWTGPAAIAICALFGPMASPEALAMPLAPGAVVRPFEARDTDGHDVRVGFLPGTATVLLFFLSGCSDCHDMLPEWNYAYDRRAANVRVLGVILDQEPPGFWKVMRLRFPVVRASSVSALRDLHPTRVPLTMRLRAGGTIEDLVVGLASRARLGSLFAPASGTRPISAQSPSTLLLVHD